MIPVEFKQIVTEDRKCKEKKDKEFFEEITNKNWEKENLKWDIEPTKEEMCQWDEKKLAFAFFTNYVCEPLEELFTSDELFINMISSFWFYLKTSVLLVHCDKEKTKGFISDYLQINMETFSPRGTFYMLQKYANQLLYAIKNPKFNYFYVYVYSDSSVINIYLEKRLFFGLL